jgi:hypothetical protein
VRILVRVCYGSRVVSLDVEMATDDAEELRRRDLEGRMHPDEMEGGRLVTRPTL